MQYDPDGNIYYKLNFNENFKILPQRPISTNLSEPAALYKERLTISHSKWKHLQELKSVIPFDTHGFYDGIRYHPDKKNKVADSSLEKHKTAKKL